MLLEQFTIAHFASLRLHTEAAAAQGAEAARMYHAVLARMLGEVRRLALSLRAYRSPASKPLFRTRCAGCPTWGAEDLLAGRRRLS